MDRAGASTMGVLRAGARKRKECSLRRLAVLTVLALALPAVSEGRSLGFRGAGLRAGVSIAPNQVAFGGHLDLGEVVPGASLLAVAEAGLGDNRILGSVGGDLLFRLPAGWEGWSPYAGGELAFLFGRLDLPGPDNEGFSDLGLMGIVGIRRELRGGNRLATEIKFGIVDAPDIKLLVVWTLAR